MIARCIQVALAALTVCALVPAQSAEQKADAVKEFKRYFRKFKEVNQKVEAVRTLEGMESPAAADELVKLLDFKVPEVARAALDVLSTYRDEATFGSWLEKLPDISNQTQRALLIQVFGRAGFKSAMPVIADIALHDRKATTAIKHAAARAVSALGDDSQTELVAALLADSDATVRMAAADSAGALRMKTLGPKVMPLLDDGAWQVQVAAVGAIGELRPAEAVEPLIELMRKGGRLEEECANALFLVTGMDFGTDADAWATTWSKLKDIPGWRIPTDEELAEKAKNRKKYDAIYKTAADKPSFGGIKTSSTRILFIIDVSGSMEDLVVEREKFDSGYANFQKLTIVKTELERTIDTLTDNTLFNIVAFASDTKTWKNFLAPANVVNRSSAKAWVRKLKPLGGKEAQGLASAGLGGAANLAAGKTNTFRALMYPFGVDPKKPKKRKKNAAVQNKIDTVFFLSDGRPTAGKIVDIPEILDAVARENDTFRIVFHTIAIGEFQKNFLRTLAEANGGTFVDLGR